MTEDKALDLALEALEFFKGLALSIKEIERAEEAITAIKQVRSAPVQDSTCSETLRAQGKAYPRTCRKCGKGPCIALVNAALDKKAENARELGLDYEPSEWLTGCPECGMDSGCDCDSGTWNPPAAQRQWVGLTDAEVMQTMSGDWTSQFYFARAIEAKLKEKNT